MLKRNEKEYWKSGVMVSIVIRLKANGWVFNRIEEDQYEDEDLRFDNVFAVFDNTYPRECLYIGWSRIGNKASVTFEPIPDETIGFDLPTLKAIYDLASAVKSADDIYRIKTIAKEI